MIIETVHHRKISELVHVYDHHRSAGKSHQESAQAVASAGSNSCDSSQIAEAIEIGAAAFWFGNRMPPSSTEGMIAEWKAAGSPV